MGIGMNTRMPYSNMLYVILPANNRNKTMVVFTWRLDTVHPIHYAHGFVVPWFATIILYSIDGIYCHVDPFPSGFVSLALRQSYDYSATDDITMESVGKFCCYITVQTKADLLHGLLYVHTALLTEINGCGGRYCQTRNVWCVIMVMVLMVSLELVIILIHWNLRGGGFRLRYCRES